jgi:hypothetical protein
MKKNIKEVPFVAENLLRRVTDYAQGKARVAMGTHLHKKSKETLAKILSECPVKGWSVARDKESDLSRAVMLGVQSAKAGNLQERNDALMREIKAEGRARLIRRGESGKQKIDRAKIAAAIRAGRDAR